MLGDYNFPGRFEKPFAHQVEMVKFHLKNPRSFNLSTMGTGKTMGALWTCDFLMTHKKISKVLVICPLSIIDSVWRKNIFENLLHRSCIVLHHPNRSKRLELLQKDADFYLINHDGVKLIEKQLIAKKFDIVVVDEMTAFKTYNTDRSRAAQRVCNSAKGVIGMTGSPISDKPEDAYGQALLVRPDNPKLPSYFGRFRDSVVTRFDDFTWIPVLGFQDRVAEVLSPAIRFELRECVDLPPTLYTDRKVAMTADQKRHFKEMQNENITMINSGVINAVNAGVRYLKLNQISSGIAIDENRIPHRIDCKPKLNEILNIWDEFGRGPIIICAVFKPVIDYIREFLEEKRTHNKTAVVTGDVNRRARSNIFENFDRGNIDFLIIQPKVAAHGLDLTRSHVLIWYAPHPSNEIYEQCNARIARPGQTRPQMIVHLSCSRADDKVYNSLKNKEKVSNTYIDILRRPI